MTLLARLKPLVRRTVTAAALLRRPMSLGVRVFLAEEGRVFLVRHTYLPGWYLPGGGVDAGETAAEAARRELAEEGGLGVEDLDLFGLYLNRRASRRDHVALFVGSGIEPLPPRPRDREIAETGFFPLEALPADTTGATRRRIAEILEGRRPDPLW
ncbi:NUDIX domain-containing protein [Prosthecomicrobium sp. N25]|uniref:NUDIX domain-containing protein n=1 Tax=Prosthecomicrobium sp. N25 TaxID=3129254 RepID=UPI003077B901